jgi:hypothetical protein
VAESRKDRGYARSKIGFRVGSIFTVFSGWLRSQPVESTFIKPPEIRFVGGGNISGSPYPPEEEGGVEGAGQPIGLLLTLTKAG